MNPQFYVLMPLEPAGIGVRLVVTGQLTSTNQHLLAPLIRRTRTAQRRGTVTVDLTGARTEEAAVDLLRWDVEHDEPADDLAAVQILDLGRHPA
ncbi:MAG: hypothetical protein ACOC84_01765 [Actinomycetota bacterium]